jgi:hypothetical protein
LPKGHKAPIIIILVWRAENAGEIVEVVAQGGALEDLSKQGEHPMPASDEYRKIAEEYYRLAREAKTETDRLALLALAQNWLEAASRENDSVPTTPL